MKIGTFAIWPNLGKARYPGSFKVARGCLSWGAGSHCALDIVIRQIGEPCGVGCRLLSKKNEGKIWWTGDFPYRRDSQENLEPE